MYNIDSIIEIFKEYSKPSQTKEFTEQDAAGSTGGSGGGKPPAYPTVTKWETGIKRGPANPVKIGKWKDVVSPTRGKGNTLL